MKASGRRKGLHCGEFYQPDRRNLRHQRYCAKPECRKRSKAESQRRWLQRPENQTYFRSPENCQRVKAWRQRHPGYRRKKKARPPAALQEVCRTQAPEAQGLSSYPGPDALQDLFSMQPAMVVGLISMMTGSTLPEDIALSHPAAAKERPGHLGYASRLKPSALALTMITKRLLCPERLRQVRLP